MLFALTGGIQTGKTRWLERLIDRLEAQGLPCAGVVAPGVWRRHAVRETASASGDGANELENFEKLGIDNVLLPCGLCISFARRASLAQAEGTFNKNSQSARAGLGWAIDDEAIKQVNTHFAALACQANEADEMDEASTLPSLLIVDELGRLELLRGEGLSEAMSLLNRGPSKAFPHALVVVREDLLICAREILEPAWGGMVVIFPDEDSAERVCQAMGCSGIVR